jgi:hypothetical protein
MMGVQPRGALCPAPSPLAGEGWGGGWLSVSASKQSPPSRRFAPTSPARGEVTESSVLVASGSEVAR